MRCTRFSGLLLAGLLVVLTGCIQSKAVLTINKDGSATLEQTAYMAKMDVPGAAAGESPFDEKKLPAQSAEWAKSMGEGVTVKSAAALKDKAGWDGVKLVYAIKDVSKFSVGYLPPIGTEMAKPDDEK